MMWVNLDDQYAYTMAAPSNASRERRFSLLALLLEIKDIDVASDDGNIVEALGLGHVVDVDLLRARIRQHGDLGARVVLYQSDLWSSA
jgi:hypothetical protein